MSKGNSPGLVVMGDNSCSNVCEFESLRHIPDGHFFKLNRLFKKTENKRKRGWGYHIFLKKHLVSGNLGKVKIRNSVPATAGILRRLFSPK